MSVVTVIMKKVQIIGLVLANSWSQDGNIIGVAIAGFDESLTQIKPNCGMNAKLIKCLNRKVIVEGMWEDNGPLNRMLNVTSLELVNERIN